MEIFLVICGKNSTSIKDRLYFEEVTSFYDVYSSEEMKEVLSDKGYNLYKNGLFKFDKGSDEKIAVYTDLSSITSIFAFLFNLPEETVNNQFSFTEESITKFWIQNYQEGYSAPRLMFLNDDTHNYMEV